jgi:hypothetical protein
VKKEAAVPVVVAVPEDTGWRKKSKRRVKERWKKGGRRVEEGTSKRIHAPNGYMHETGNTTGNNQWMHASNGYVPVLVSIVPSTALPTLLCPVCCEE